MFREVYSEQILPVLGRFPFLISPAKRFGENNSEFIALIADRLQLQLKSAEVGNY